MMRAGTYAIISLLIASEVTSFVPSGLTWRPATISRVETRHFFSMTADDKVGFIGLGIMGKGMAQNLIKGGKKLVVWNRTTKKAEEFCRETGAEMADTPREVIEKCGTTYSMLSTPEAAREVFYGNDWGVLAGLGEGKNLVDCATLRVNDMEDIYKEATGKGARFLEAPVSGSKLQGTDDTLIISGREYSPALSITLNTPVSRPMYRWWCHYLTLNVPNPMDPMRALLSFMSNTNEYLVEEGPAASGTLVFLCGGDKALFDVAGDDLDLMGKAKYFLGPIGYGTRMKLVVNMVMATMLSSLAEGMSLASAADLNNSDLIDILAQGAMANPMFALKGPCMMKQDYDPNFPLKHAQKDIQFALGLGDEVGQTLPVAAAANAEYQRAKTKHAEDDFCAVIEALQAKPGP